MLKFRLITPNTSQISFIDPDSFLFLLQNNSEKEKDIEGIGKNMK